MDNKVKDVLRSAKTYVDDAGQNIVSEMVALESATVALSNGKKIIAVEKEKMGAFGAYDKPTKKILISDITLQQNGVAYNAMVNLQRGLYNIQNGFDLTMEEEYAFEVLHHERMHAEAVGWRNGRIDSLSRPMEALNQLCARHSYGRTLSLFGRNPQHNVEILEKGYSYNTAVTNLRKMINAIGVEEKEFVHKFDAILRTTYSDDIQDVLVEYFQRKGIRNARKLIKKSEARNLKSNYNQVCKIKRLKSFLDASSVSFR